MKLIKASLMKVNENRERSKCYLEFYAEQKCYDVTDEINTCHKSPEILDLKTVKSYFPFISSKNTIW